TYNYNNEFGCPSTDTLYLVVHHGTHNVTDTTVCDSLTWNGHLYTESGTYTYDYFNANASASTDTLHLIVHYGTHNVTTETACESYTWEDGTGETYTESGIYTYDYTNELGCASTDTLLLTVNYGTHNVTDTIVSEFLTWNRETYTESGSYTYNYNNEFGCPSTDTLYLVVHHGTHNVTDTTVCDSLTWNGQLYTESGTYTYDYFNANASASTDTLHLIVHYGTHNVTTETACESYTWAAGTGETYTVSGTYTFDYDNELGCSSTDTLNLTIHHGTHNMTDTIACESYTWNGETYTTSGTYTYDYDNEFGCASTDTLHLTVHYGTHNVTTETACESYTWTGGTGETYTTSGTYTYDYTNELGCLSTDTLHLTIHYGTHNVTTETACESYTWTNGTGETYTESGTYTYDYTNEFGCASTDTLHLVVHYGTHNVTTETVCERYTWTNGTGETYTTSGTYTYDYTNEFGCSSTDTLHLTVNYGTHNVTTETACESYTWTDGTGETYTTTGTYTYDYTNELGCPSTDTLHLTINYGTHNVTTETVCDSYTWTSGTGETYSASGTYTYDYENEFGCASTDTLHLTIQYGTYNVITETACESYTWTDGTGETYTESGTYTYDYDNEFGCPSADTLNLTIHHGTHNMTDTIACESYTWNGEAYTTSGTYIYDYDNEFGCASSDTLHLTVHYGTHNVTTETVCESYTWTDGTGETYTQSGVYLFDYQNEEDCASTDTLHLTVYYSTQTEADTTVCESHLPLEWRGVTFTEGGTQNFMLTTSHGCDSIVSLTMNSIDDNLQVVMLTEDPCENFEAELLAQTGMSEFSWSTGETTPQITTFHSGTYVVTATEGNCIATADIFIPECDFFIYLPNAITSSFDDGLNDDFFVPQYSQRQIMDFDIHIYNRWGQLVYQSEDKNFHWDGSCNGKIIANTTYTYVIHCTNYNGKKYLFKGTITVL
ncbi:MAG: gliding motility-associated C-terminal domain-containing protein, partial [Bacteroidales bacterium]|nr:gliding motility-associated C-terminal domain-containing protein [Bacteroidales bacterium]